jgi:uncharacterized protein YbjT (DUF2867 family)
MKVALFGSTGNLGMVLHDRLLAKGYQVRALTRHETPTKKLNSMYTYLVMHSNILIF